MQSDRIHIGDKSVPPVMARKPKNPINIKTFFKDNIDFQKQLPFLKQAFNQRVLLLGWPREEKEEVLEQWFEDNYDIFFRQIGKLVRKTVRGKQKDEVTSLLAHQLYQILITLSDDDLFKQFEALIKVLSEEGSHTACKASLIKYTLEAKALVLTISQKDSPLMKEALKAWSTVFKKATLNYGTTCDNVLSNAHIIIISSVTVFNFYVSYQRLHLKNIDDLTVIICAFGSFAFGLVALFAWPHIYAVNVLLNQLYYLLCNKGRVPSFPTPELDVQDKLYPQIMGYIQQRVLEHRAGNEAKPDDPVSFSNVLALSLPAPEFKQSVFTKDSTSVIATKLKSPIQKEKHLLIPRPIPKNEYDDHEIKTGEEYCVLLQMEPRNLYILFDTETVSQLFGKKNSERDELTERFFQCLHHTRRLPPPTKSERNSEKSPYYGMDGKKRLFGTPYRLAFQLFSPCLAEEKKLVENEPNVKIQKPRRVVRHGQHGYE